MKPCWEHIGLTDDGAEKADKALPMLMEVAKIMEYSSAV